MKTKSIILFILANASIYAQAPLNFTARLNVTNVSGSDPYTLTGVVQDGLGLWSASDLNVSADSIYHLEGSDLLIYRITSISSASGNNFVIVVDDIMNSGVLPSTGNEWAAIEFTTNYQYPIEVGNLSTNLKAAIDNRFKQRLDDKLLLLEADGSFYSTSDTTTFSPSSPTPSNGDFEWWKNRGQLLEEKNGFSNRITSKNGELVNMANVVNVTWVFSDSTTFDLNLGNRFRCEIEETLILKVTNLASAEVGDIFVFEIVMVETEAAQVKFPPIYFNSFELLGTIPVQWLLQESTRIFTFKVLEQGGRKYLSSCDDLSSGVDVVSASQGLIDSSNVIQLGNPISVTNSVDRLLVDRYIPLNGKKLSIGDATNTAIQIDGTSSDNRLGFFTASPSQAIGIGGDINRTMRMERTLTANANGSNLTIQAGGATVGATNKSGGNLILSAGESTGTGLGSGGGNIIFTVPVPSSSGTTDNFIFTRMTLTRDGRLGVNANFAAPLGETLVLGNNGGVTGTMSMSGITSGKVVLKPADAAGTWTLTLPTTDGDAGQALVTNGSGVASWTYPGVNPALSPAWTPAVFSNTTDTIVTVRYSSFSVTDSVVSFQINFEISPTLSAGVPTNIITSYGFLPPITKNFASDYDAGVTVTCPQIGGFTGGLAAVQASGLANAIDDKIYISVINTTTNIGASGGNFLVSVTGQYKL